MSQRKFMAEVYPLTADGQRITKEVNYVEFGASLLYKSIVKAVEKRIEKRPENNGYEVVVYKAVRFWSEDRKKVMSYKVQY